MNFEVDIEDAAHLAGITSAREARNATLPDIPNPDFIATEGNTTIANPDYIPAQGSPTIPNPDHDPDEEGSLPTIPNPDYVEAEGETDIPNPDYVAGTPDLPETIADIGLTTDEEYVQFVMEKAAESYAKQYPAD